MQNQPRRTLQVVRSGERQKHKPKAWSHQDELKALRGKEILVTLLDGGRIRGELIEADAFALKVRFADKSILTYYKHAVKHYEEFFGA